MKEIFTIKALRAIRDNDICCARDFAHLMWPKEHLGWQRVGKQGHGSHRGVGMVLAGGAFLGKLHKWELVRNFIPFKEIIRLTDKDRQVLSDQINTEG